MIQLEADSLSDLFIDPKRDGTAATLLDPAFSIDFYRDRPRSDGTSRAYVSLMTGRVTWRPGPDYGTRQRIAVDFRRKSVELDVFYQMEMEPSKDLSGGLNSLEGSFMSVHSFQLDSLFEIDSMYVYPQAIPTRFSVLSFQRAERTVDCSFSCTDSGLGTHGYVRRIAVGELTGNAQRLH